MGPSAHGLLSIQQLPGEDWLLQITEPVFSGWAVETSGGEHWQQCGLSHGECLQPCAPEMLPERCLDQSPGSVAALQAREGQQHVLS